MSVIGISPTDIVSGTRVLAKGIRAVGDHGARATYEEASKNLRLRRQALQSMRQFAVSTPDFYHSESLRINADSLLNQDDALQFRLRKYESKLGPNKPSSRRHGIYRKERWAFSEEEDLRQHHARTAPGMEAAIIESTISGAKQTQARVSLLGEQVSNNHRLVLRRLEKFDLESIGGIESTQQQILAGLESNERRVIARLSCAQKELAMDISRCLDEIRSHASVLERRHDEFLCKLSNKLADYSSSVPTCKNHSSMNSIHRLWVTARSKLTYGESIPKLISAEKFVAAQAHINIATNAPSENNLNEPPPLPYQLESSDALWDEFLTHAVACALFVLDCVISGSHATGRVLQELLLQASNDPVFLTIMMGIRFCVDDG